jgi:hypothetical protein
LLFILHKYLSESWKSSPKDILLIIWFMGATMLSTSQLHGLVTLLDYEFVPNFRQYLDLCLVKLISAWLLEHFMVIALEVPHILNLALLNDTHIDIGSRSQVVVDSSLDGFHHQGDSFVLS